MSTLIITLLIAGIISGLIQFFVDFKKLPVDDTSVASFASVHKGWLKSIYDFFTAHWQFFAYILLGIAGAFLVPLIVELTREGLPGLASVKAFTQCLNDHATGVIKTGQCHLNPWYLLVLFGYGIVSGYSSVRLIRSIGAFFIGNISKRQQEQQAQLEEAQKQIAELKNKLPQPPATSALEAGFDILGQSVNSGDDSAAAEELKEIAGFEGCPDFPRPWDSKPWRVAESLKQLKKQVDALAPARSRLSDGTIGDGSHQGTNSDHNPWVFDRARNMGIVTAIDITHDQANKCDCHVLAASLETGKDPRIKYVIWNRRIMNSLPINGSPSWTWRPYSGINPHDKHMHISVKCDNDIVDLVGSWLIQVS